MIIIAIYAIIVLALTLYSYVLVDPSLTLVSAQWWVDIRVPLINIGFHERGLSIFLYILIVFLLFIAHYYLLKKYPKLNAFRLGLVIGGLLFMSYPFLSRDLFSYMFDARILTHYGQNPYLFAPLDFPQDDWLRFMHWIHRSYPYGPTFLPLTLIPSFLSMGKFILNLVLFKGLFVGFYLLGIYVLRKMNNAWALIFATHPLILIEGLVNAHNDLIAVSFGLVGIYYLSKNKSIMGKVFLFLSAGIKYLTLPLIFLSKENKKMNYLVIALQAALVGYLVLFREIQPWYFLTFFVFLPYYAKYIRMFDIFFLALLLSYFPYIFYGSWDDIWIKQAIIIIGFILNLGYLLYKKQFLSK